MGLLFEIELDLAAKGSRDSSRTLYRQLKAAIVDGRLTAGAKLQLLRQDHAPNNAQFKPMVDPRTGRGGSLNRGLVTVHGRAC